jgi:hypothetical protein
MASVASLAFESQLIFSDRVAQLLDRIDRRPACSEEEREAIFRLRCHAYLHEGAIGPNFSGTFCDPYDDSENAWLFGLYLEGTQPSSSGACCSTAICRLRNSGFGRTSWRPPSSTPLEALATKSSRDENISLFRGLRPIENINHFSPLRLCER